MKIGLVIRNMNRKLPRGGAERVLVELAGELVRRGHEVTVFCTDINHRKDFMYPLSDGVEYRNLFEPDRFADWFKLKLLGALMYLTHSGYQWFIKPLFTAPPDPTTFTIDRDEKPASQWMRYAHGLNNALYAKCSDIQAKQFSRYKSEVLVFFMPSYLFTNQRRASADRSFSVVFSLRNLFEYDLGLYRGNPAERAKFEQALGLADAITVLLPDFRADLPEPLRSKVRPIPNPIPPVDANKMAVPGAETDHGTILAVGRLASQKNHAVLVRAFVILHEKYPNWRVKIFGEGELRGELTKLVQELGLGDRVLLMGDTPDLSPHYQAAHIFAMPSRFEGFGLTLGEAMAHGLPAVGFDKARGVNALIEPGRNGLLATADDPVESFAENLEKLMANPELRAELGRGGIETAQRYAPEAVYDLWENTLSEVVKNRG